MSMRVMIDSFIPWYKIKFCIHVKELLVHLKIIFKLLLIHSSRSFICHAIYSKLYEVACIVFLTLNIANGM